MYTEWKVEVDWHLRFCSTVSCLLASCLVVMHASSLLRYSARRRRWFVHRWTLFLDLRDYPFPRIFRCARLKGHTLMQLDAQWAFIHLRHSPRCGSSMWSSGRMWTFEEFKVAARVVWTMTLHSFHRFQASVDFSLIKKESIAKIQNQVLCFPSF